MADVTLPSLGESVTEGIITQWFKKVGDLVARDEPLFEVSTDKVDSEMPSPAAGVLVEILFAEGDTVETGARVAVIDESQSVATSSDAPASPATPKAVAPAPTAVVTPRENSINGILLSPVVRRILIDGQVDPSTISGTGPGGAISRRDAELAVLRGPTPEVALAQSAGRRRMGQHMAHSWSTAPHGFVAIEVAGDCFTQLDQLNAASSDVPIADEVVVALAAVRALAEFPVLNATIDGEQVMQQRSVNLGFAQSLGDDGMLVPVVHAVAGLKLRSLSQRVHELNAHVATRQLSADDLIGGTFTIQGAESKNAITSQPLLIQPQVAVLSVHVQRNVPVVVTSDVPTLSVGNTLVLGLSFDHRVCDAWTAAAFLESVATHLTELDLTDEG